MACVSNWAGVSNADLLEILEECDEDVSSNGSVSEVLGTEKCCIELIPSRVWC